MTLAQELNEWTAFFALAGGAAATLLGLVFVAVSLRLEIFRRADVEDVRLFAAFTLWTFLFAGTISGLALAPHEQPERLALILLPLTLGGFLVIVRIFVVWRRLNPDQLGLLRRDNRKLMQGPSYLAGMAIAHIGLIAVVGMLWLGHPDALGLLALIDISLLGLGTLGAWLMLSHAKG